MKDEQLTGWLLHRKPAGRLSPESYERDRLIEVGHAVGIDLRVISPDQIDLVVTADDRKSVLVKSKPVDLPDFIIPRMGSETTYFALAVIRHLERLGVRSFNKSSAIEVVRDKLYTQQILAASDLPFAKTMLVKFPVNVRRVRQLIGFPVVVKTLSGQQGQGITLCESESALEDMMHLVAATSNNANIILQEFVPDSYGRDVRVMVVGGRVIAAMERRAKPGTFKSNLSRGGKGHPLEIDEELEWMATETARLLDLDVAGIDLLFDKGHYRICEANSAPGFKGIDACTGADMASTILAYVSLSLGNLVAAEAVMAYQREHAPQRRAISNTGKRPVHDTARRTSTR